MTKYTVISLILLIVCLNLFAISVISNKAEIKNLKIQVDSLTIEIDSLLLEIDTLESRKNIWDFNFNFKTVHLISAIMDVESSNNDLAYHKGEDAVGCLQIRKCMVNDVNRILKRQNSNKRFAYNDRWNRYKSIQMFDIYCKHYNLNSAEEKARCWNGGPKGSIKESTLGYWAKVKNKLKINS